MNDQTPLTHDELRRFTGDLERYRHSFNRRVIYTPGVQHLAERAGAYWLIDLIASYIGTPEMSAAIEADARLGDMQFWRLDVPKDGPAVASLPGRCRRATSHHPGHRVHGLPARSRRYLGRVRWRALDALSAVGALTDGRGGGVQLRRRTPPQDADFFSYCPRAERGRPQGGGVVFTIDRLPDVE